MLRRRIRRVPSMAAAARAHTIWVAGSSATLGPSEAAVGAREQEGGHGGLLAVFHRHEAAQKHPLTMIAAARERPPSGNAEAALGARHLAGRRIRRRNQGLAALAPHLFLRGERKQRELP